MHSSYPCVQARGYNYCTCWRVAHHSLSPDQVLDVLPNPFVSYTGCAAIAPPEKKGPKFSTGADVCSLTWTRVRERQGPRSTLVRQRQGPRSTTLDTPRVFSDQALLSGRKNGGGQFLTFLGCARLLHSTAMLTPGPAPWSHHDAMALQTQLPAP
eukprot:3101404-Rhodomonas_salina.4